MSEVVIRGIGDTASLTAGLVGAIDQAYHVFNATTADDATEALRTYLQQTYGLTPTLGSLTLDNIAVGERTEDFYDCTASWRRFARREQPAVGESQFEFSLAVQPVRVKVPVGTVTVYKSAQAADWQPQIINDIGDGEEPDGVEVFEPTYDESVTAWVQTSTLTQAYRTQLKRAIGKTNSTAFKGWQPGEVLLMGVSGTRRGQNDSELNFRWSVRENQDDITIGDVTGIQKKGWQYLWPRSEARGGTDAPIVKTVTHVAVATVFREYDFNLLNIPG